MKKVKKQQTKYANKHYKLDKVYSIGEIVLLLTKNMPKQPSKIDSKWCEPFKVIKVRPKQTYHFELLKDFVIYLVFHTNLLKKYKANNNSKFPREALIKLGPTNEENQEWEIKRIINFVESKRYGKRYRVYWKSYGPAKDQ